MSEAQPLEVAVDEVQTSGSHGRLGMTVVIVAAVALVGAFIPLGTIAAGVLGALGLIVGLGCLVRDPGFNLAALGGTLLSSAAVAVAVIMTFVYA